MFYFKNNGIITLKKHVDANCELIAKKFEEKMNGSMKVQWKDNLQRKGLQKLLLSLTFWGQIF